jgi:hypothetical protein
MIQPKYGFGRLASGVAAILVPIALSSGPRLTDALLRLRPFGAPQKTAWAPTPLAYRGPVSLLAKLLRIYR